MEVTHSYISSIYKRERSLMDDVGEDNLPSAALLTFLRYHTSDFGNFYIDSLAFYPLPAKFYVRKKYGVKNVKNL